VWFTDERKYVVSEASVYRLLKAHDLITSPAYVVIKAANEFKDKPYHGDTAESRPGGVKRGGFPTSAHTYYAGVPFTTNFMAFDERGAGAEDSRQRQEQAADRRSPDGTNNPRQDRDSTAVLYHRIAVND
jgi:hypothetical protein